MNFWQIVSIAALIVITLFLWRLAMEAVESKILKIRTEAREGSTWVAVMAHSRFWFVVAMALAPLLIVGYGVFLIVTVFSLEIWSYVSEDFKILQKRVHRH